MFHHNTSDASPHQHTTVEQAIRCEEDLATAAIEAGWEAAAERAFIQAFETDERQRAETDEDEARAAALGLAQAAWEYRTEMANL